MALHDRVKQIRERAIAEKRVPIAPSLQGVTRERIANVLAMIDRNTPDTIDVVFALMDNHNSSWFPKASNGTVFSDGATTAHIGCHVGILQRGKGKLDREGRDYWLKPLWEIGAVEKVFLDTTTGSFLLGHPIAKSSNSAYRLSESFVKILKAPANEWKEFLSTWVSEDAVRSRLKQQAFLASQTAMEIDNKHEHLIQATIAHYAPTFLHGYQVLYTDLTDGDRITEADKICMAKAGVQIDLEDAMPDVLLWNEPGNRLWEIEAVTSDGEVDYHKFQQLTSLAQRSGMNGIGFTTAYRTWIEAARRQARFKNIHPETYIWILEDPTKHFFVSASPLPDSQR